MHINRPLSSYDEKEKAIYTKLLNRKLKKQIVCHFFSIMLLTTAI